MFLSSTEIYNYLKKDIFFKDSFEFTILNDVVAIGIRIGGFNCNLKVYAGESRVIKADLIGLYSVKVMNELFYDYKNFNLYNFFFKKAVKRNRFILLDKRKCHLNNLKSVIVFIINYFYENIVHINSSFRAADEIKILKNNQIAFDICDNFSKKNLDLIETMDQIYNKKMSISRFGDGELNLVIDLNRHTKFQKNSFIINDKLTNILSKRVDNLLVCLPLLTYADGFWKNYWMNNWYLFSHTCKLDIYGSAQISRPIFFQKYGLVAVESWKKIWRNKRVCFVYGEGSRFNINHILFDEISEVKQVLGKATNAFDDYDRLFSSCKEVLDDVDIFLIALGQTGTVLSAALCLEGGWALDVGHLPNSYDTVFKNTATPEQLPLSK